VTGNIGEVWFPGANRPEQIFFDPFEIVADKAERIVGALEKGNLPIVLRNDSRCRGHRFRFALLNQTFSARRRKIVGKMS